MTKKWQFISGAVATLARNSGSFAPDYAYAYFFVSMISFQYSVIILIMITFFNKNQVFSKFQRYNNPLSSFAESKGSDGLCV